MNSLCSVELSCINILISDQCIPGTCVFYNSWWKIFFPHPWSNNQLSCGILRKIFTMRAGDYERIINYDWPSKCLRHSMNRIQRTENRNIRNQQNAIVLFWWQHLCPKQWIWQISSGILVLINRIQSKDHRIGHMNSAKFHCLVLMTKFISKTTDMMNYLLNIRLNYEKTVTLITI